MDFDLLNLLARERGQGTSQLAEHVNPRFATVLRTIGFDREYVLAEGAHLWDAKGHRYLDFLAGYAVCNLSRNHPTVTRALQDALALDLPSMVQ